MSKSKGTEEGQVVVVPEGIPYFVRKRPESKKGARKIEKKKKRLVARLEKPAGEEVFFAPEEEAEIEEWEREMKEYEEREEEDEGEEEGEIEYGDESPEMPETLEEEEPEEEELEEERKGKKEKKGREEEGEELVRVEDPFFSSKKAYAKSLGIPFPQSELVLRPEKVRRRIYETETRYPGYKYMKVGADGELVPLVEMEPRTIKMTGEELPLKPKRKYTPEKKIETRQNPYDARYPFGAYVSFQEIPLEPAEEGEIVEEGLKVEGIVLSFSEDGVDVSVKGRMYFVRYSNPTLKVVPRPKRVKTPVKREQTLDDYYASPEIPVDFRDMMVKAYIELLRMIRDPFKPSKKMAVVEWKMLQSPPIQWEEYYAAEYQKWIYAKYYEIFVDELDDEAIEVEARKLVERESSVDGLISQVTSVLPNGLEYDTTIDQLLDALREQSALTVFQAHLIRVLEKEIISGGGKGQEQITRYVPAAVPKGELEGPSRYYRQPGKPAILRTSPRQIAVPETIERKPISGTNLAIIIQTAIDTYQRFYQPNLSRAIETVRSVAINQRFDEYEPTDADRAEFEEEYLPTLIDLHFKAEKTYQDEKKKAKEIEVEEKKFEASLRAYHAGLEESVKKFEQIIYASNGGSLHSYLAAVLVPYIFLDGPLSPHAKFFKAKLANGDFEFSALTGANLAHYLPELSMNRLTDQQFAIAEKILGTLLKIQMDSLVNLYITSINPTSRTTYTSLRVDAFKLVAPLVGMLKDPSEICLRESGTGRRPVVKGGRYVYAPGTQDLLMEKIPPGEMTICYSDGKFTCHDIRSVLRSISASDVPINPYTGRPYPQEFVEKMKARYTEQLADPSLWEEPEEPIPEPIIEPSPPKIKKRTLPKVQVKKVRPRHKPPKKAKGQIEKIGLVGDEFDLLTIFGETSFNAGDQTYEYTTDLADKGVNVVVFGFDALRQATISDINPRVVPKGAYIYVIGVNASKVKPVDRTKLNRRIKKILPKAQAIFYVDENSEEDLIAGLVDVAIDMEALNVE
jgi:hypothetical protein